MKRLLVCLAVALILAGCTAIMPTQSGDKPSPPPHPSQNDSAATSRQGSDSSTHIGTKSQEPVPQLVEMKEKHFSIAVPSGWKVTTRTEIGDQVIITDTSDPQVYISVFTLMLAGASHDDLAKRWEFKGRDPQQITSPLGLPGVLAQGPLQTDPKFQVLTAGYVRPGMWEQVAQATAPEEKFQTLLPTFQAIIASFTPRVASVK